MAEQSEVTSELYIFSGVARFLAFGGGAKIPSFSFENALSALVHVSGSVKAIFISFVTFP